MSDRRDPVDMPGCPRPDRWTVSWSQVGIGFHVTPVKGLIRVGNWALNPYRRRGLWNLLAQLWRMSSGAYLRREYPRTEQALRKAIVECSAYCEGENAAEAAAAAVLGRVTGDRP